MTRWQAFKNSLLGFWYSFLTGERTVVITIESFPITARVRKLNNTWTLEEEIERECFTDLLIDEE